MQCNGVSRSGIETLLMTIARLTQYSEPYGSTGNIGENLQRLLGTHSLDPLQTVIREAVQNIADAAILGIGPEIVIGVRRLTPGQHAVLASQVVRGSLQEAHSNELLTTMRARQELVVMEICDFGTVGLGGPTRADRVPAGVERTDFIDFLRNIGTARDTQLGGGTYGFGKMAFFGASRCKTIIVDSLPHGAGPKGRRLMGCHCGPSFEVPENGMRKRFTGRHWWGIPDPDDGIVDPVTGLAASDLASALGLPGRASGRSGTSVMIVDLDAGDEDLQLLGNRVVEGLLWSFWPRMMRDTPADVRFTCRVEVDGSPLPIPYPEDFQPLALFAKAMRAVRSGVGNKVKKIASQRPKKELGTLAIERGLRTRRRPLVDDGSLFPESSRHIALMRPVELIVKYLEGTPLPDERLEWAGVFVASREEEVESAFAESEPPSHDDWKPNSLPRGNTKRYVNIALRQLKRTALDMGLASTGQPQATEAGPPLAHVARRLGAMLEGDGGVQDRPRPGGGGARPARAKATRPLFEKLELVQSGCVAVFSTEVSQDAQRTGLALTARPAVAIEGASRLRADDGFEQPAVVSIRAADGSLSGRGENLDLAGAEGSFEIRVFVPESCAVTVEAKVLTRLDR